MTDIQIHSSSRTTVDVTFEGRRAQLGFQDTGTERLLADADRLDQRAAEDQFRARRLRAIAEVLAAEKAERTAEAKRVRNAKAKATRARNKDPFGFQAEHDRKVAYEAEQALHEAARAEGHEALLQAGLDSGRVEIISVTLPKDHR